jgi:hypothetical protein
VQPLPFPSLAFVVVFVSALQICHPTRCFQGSDSFSSSQRIAIAHLTEESRNAAQKIPSHPALGERTKSCPRDPRTFGKASTRFPLRAENAPIPIVLTALAKTGHFRFIQYQTATLLNTRSVSQQTSLSTTTHYWRSSVPYSPPHLVSNHRQRYLIVEFAYQSQPGGIPLLDWLHQQPTWKKLRSEIGRPTPIR